MALEYGIKVEWHAVYRFGVLEIFRCFQVIICSLLHQIWWRFHLWTYHRKSIFKFIIRHDRSDLSCLGLPMLPKAWSEQASSKLEFKIHLIFCIHLRPLDLLFSIVFRAFKSVLWLSFYGQLWLPFRRIWLFLDSKLLHKLILSNGLLIGLLFDLLMLEIIDLSWRVKCHVWVIDF